MSEENEEIVEIDEKQKELDELNDRYKRLMAEFENFKKRSSKERDNLYSSILSDIVGTLLPAIDNLEKAAISSSTDENYKQGIELVLKQFMDLFTTLGVKKIPTVGEAFNPELHDAVSTVVDENLGEKIIKEEFRPGYEIGGKVIRHAMVIVAN